MPVFSLSRACVCLRQVSLACSCRRAYLVRLLSHTRQAQHAALCSAAALCRTSRQRTRHVRALRRALTCRALPRALPCRAAFCAVPRRARARAAERCLPRFAATHATGQSAPSRSDMLRSASCPDMPCSDMLVFSGRALSPPCQTQGANPSPAPLPGRIRAARAGHAHAADPAPRDRARNKPRTGGAGAAACLLHAANQCIRVSGGPHLCGVRREKRKTQSNPESLTEPVRNQKELATRGRKQIWPKLYVSFGFNLIKIKPKLL